jgi:formiminotetrahydrofolate cyclodeaminase
MYKLSGVTKRYTRGKETVEALRGVDLVIEDGDQLVIPGQGPRPHARRIAAVVGTGTAVSGPTACVAWEALPMRDEKISDFLTRLADRVPAPGGGASAALHAAQAAALLGMVARYSTGEKYAAHQPVIERVIAETDKLRAAALRLAEEDAAAFTAVTDAYRLPKGTDEEKAARSAAIAAALAGAAEPPAEVIAVARAVVGLAEELLPIGNRNVVTDIAAATEAARAAATTARVNVEINLGGIRDDQTRTALAAEVAGVDAVVARAENVTATVRKDIAR